MRSRAACARFGGFGDNVAKSYTLRCSSVTVLSICRGEARCPEHGWHEALQTSSDASWHLDSFKYNKPGAIPYDFATTAEQGCPNDCGLCPEHQQHTCVGVIEITTRCNLSCPTCFADAGAGPSTLRQGEARSGQTPLSTGYDLSVAQVEAMLDRLLETEGQPRRPPDQRR